MAARKTTRKTRRTTNSSEATHNKIPKGYTKDRETGMIVPLIPKVEQTEHPDVAVDDFDINNLDAEADKWLSPLRVAPSEEELKRQRLIRKRRREQARREYEKEYAEEIRKNKEREDDAYM